MRTHFVPPRHRKKRLGRSRLIDVLSRWIGLSTHILLSGRLKIRLRWIRWSDVSRCQYAMRTNFVLPGHRKNDLGDSLNWCLSRRRALWTHSLPSGLLNKRHWWSRSNDVSGCRKVIFFFLGIQKKIICQSLLDGILSRWMCLKIHILPFDRLKKRLWRSR
jgi:hypothetical protein